MNVERLKRQLTAGPFAVLWASLSDNSLLAVVGGRLPRKTATMIKGKPGENQGGHLDHLAHREMPGMRKHTVGQTGTHTLAETI